MSSHAPHPVQPAKSSRTWTIASVVGIVLVLLLLSVATRFRPYSTWSTSSGRVLGTRISLAGFRNSGEARPAQIYYVGEAQVVYTAKGKELTIETHSERRSIPTEIFLELPSLNTST